MAVSKVQKIAILAQLRDEVASQKAVVLLTTRGTDETISASKNFELRSKADKQGMKLTVVKNTLIPLTFTGATMPELVGQTYLVYKKDWNDTDEVTVPKSIVDIIADGFEKNVIVLGSVVNGEFYDSAKTVLLSKTPTKQDSLAMLAGLIQQLGGGKIATLIKEIPTQTARAISEVAKAKK
jgi:ribosomal protein L10